MQLSSAFQANNQEYTQISYTLSIISEPNVKTQVILSTNES